MKSGAGDELFEQLTHREHEILTLIADGLSNQEIADQLFIALSTVKWFIRQIFNKIGVENRRQAIARARSSGLLDASPQPRIQPPHNLPAQITPFVGRAAELADLAAILDDPANRLVTILAPGGMGKSRLALEAARQQIANYPDGVFFVPLAPLSSLEHLITAIATPIGCPFQQDSRTPKQQLVDFLQAKQLLLVLDNFEHLLDGAPLVTEILANAPELSILVTSRERLNLGYETVYTLVGLQIPEGGSLPDEMLDCDAVTLFLQGARRTRPGFEMQEADWPSLARICQLVDGMPLAMVLAAAWVEILPVPEIADEIHQNMDFLAAEMRDAPPRQWSIHAVLDSTWQRLSPAQQQVFMTLSVFRGGFDRRAVQRVAGARLQDVQAFVNKAILTRTDDDRYMIHELLRQYAENRLITAGRYESVRDSHSAYYAALVHGYLDNLKGGNQLKALQNIESDFQNIRLGWEWGLSRGHYADVDLYMDSIGLFFWSRSRYQDGIAWFVTGVRLLAGESEGAARAAFAHALGWQAAFLEYMWMVDEVVPIARQALAIAREQGDKRLIAFCAHVLGMGFHIFPDDTPEVPALLDESLALFNELGDTFFMGRVYHTMAAIEIGRNQWDDALDHVEKGLALRREINDRLGIGATLINMSDPLQETGRWEEAEQCMLESLAISREFGHIGNLGFALRNLIAQNFYKGDFQQVDLYLTEGLALARAHDLRFHIEAFLHQRSLWHLLHEQYAEAHYFALEALEVARLASGNVTEHFEAVYPLASLGGARCGLNDYADVEGHLRQALVWARTAPAGNITLRYCLTGLALVFAHNGQPEQALELAALVANHPQTPGWWSKREPLSRRLLNDLRQILPAQDYTRAWERGKQLDMNETVADLAVEIED